MPSTSTSSVLSADVGRQIRNARTELGLTQVEVAERMGVSDAYIATVEAGKHNATLGQLDKIARALDAGLVINFDVVKTKRILDKAQRASAQRHTVSERVRTHTADRTQ